MTIPKMIPRLLDESVAAVVDSVVATADPLMTRPSILSLPELMSEVSPEATELTLSASSIKSSESILMDPLLIFLRMMCLLPNANPNDLL